MKNKKQKELFLSLKVLDNETNEVVIQEQKGCKLLSLDDELLNHDLVYTCYSNISTNNSGIPSIDELVLYFNKLLLSESQVIASRYLNTPDGTYPHIKINKIQIKAKNKDFALQRISQHVELFLLENEFEIYNGIEDYLTANQITFEHDGNIINSPIIEVW